MNFTPDVISVYNLIGEKVAFKQEKDVIDLTGSPKGIYFITVLRGIDSFTRKVILR
jgi:hypothetical protein